MKKRKCVLVTWVDTTEYAGWLDEECIEETTATVCRTIGWLMESNEQVLRVAGSRSSTGKYTSVTVIVRGCIIKIRNIKL